MQLKRHFSRDFILLLLLTIAVFCLTIINDNSPATAESEKFDRAQNIIANLNKEKGCAGWWLLQDIRKAQEMDHDLGKAHLQIEEADRIYSRERGQRDERYLSALLLKVEKVQQDRRQLELDLHDAFDTMRASIKDVLILDPERKAKAKSKKS